MLAADAEKTVLANTVTEKDKQLAQLAEDIVFFKDALAKVRETCNPLVLLGDANGVGGAEQGIIRWLGSTAAELAESSRDGEAERR